MARARGAHVRVHILVGLVLPLTLALALARAAASVEAAVDPHDGWEAGWDPGDDANVEGEAAYEDEYDEDDEDDEDLLGGSEDEVLGSLFAKQALDPEDLAGYDFENGMESGGLLESSTFEAELANALRETIPDAARINEAAVEPLASLEDVLSFIVSEDDPELLGGCVLGLFAFSESPNVTLPTQAPKEPNVLASAWNEFIEASEMLVSHGHRFAYSRSRSVLKHYNVAEWAIIVVQPPMLARAELGDPLQVRHPASDGPEPPSRTEIAAFVGSHAFPTVMLITYENEDAIDNLGVPVLTVHGDFDREHEPTRIKEYVDMLGRVSQRLQETAGAQTKLSLANRALDSTALRFFSAELACLKSERTTKGKMCVVLRLARGAYYRMPPPISEDNIVAFIQSVLEGKMKPTKLQPQASQAASGPDRCAADTDSEPSQTCPSN
ncbi:Protein disulfide-isomerase A3 [Hondaea fermentalgiana]|uniref:Protein disulfide-isomerase A3 n=1 Tax=Hondaea fermentalgiana TaxID=2315210 RepID=A0A2R5G0W4_9STRA|nr:Protein disulfide-isomerase A3 [Hondaea fermentalgiana]|eukprot:GBG24165.1 Protein disulfide-isomerase A3 [Hondaea fermentalgiana]